MSMLASVSNFGNNAAALEKTLRLAQALSQIGASLALTATDAAPWVLARGQFNLSRRFFRLHKWIDHFRLVAPTSNDGVANLLEMAKNGFLGVYFLLEMGTITNVMNLTSTTWGPQVTRESNKFWFYGIVMSILLGLYQIFFAGGVGSPATPTAREVKSNSKEKADGDIKSTPTKTDSKNTQLYRQLLIDSCDLFIPGAAVGWIPSEPLTVGVFMSTSSILAMGSLWSKIQTEATAAEAAKKKKAP